MRDIYTKACKVIVWLGEAKEESAWPPVTLKEHITKTNKNLTRWAHENTQGTLRDWQRGTTNQLLEWNYWSRMWTVQEFTLASDVLICLGCHSLSFWRLLDIICSEHDTHGVKR